MNPYEHPKPSHNLSITPVKCCQICGKVGHGQHFGAFTCRACAAFFRRFAIGNNFKKCESNKKCGLPKNGWFNCKSCRLKRCRNLGMTIDNFQFDRDPCKISAQTLNKKIPSTVDIFFGRPNLIIYCAKQAESTDHFKYDVNLQYLIDKVEKVLEKGPDSLIYSSNALEKLAFGLQKTCWPECTANKKTVTRFGRDETFALWESEILKTAKWLTFFDEFQELPLILKLEIVKSGWNIWSRLLRLATGAMARREKNCDEHMLATYLNDEFLVCDYKNLNIDLSWCSKYTFEQLKFFRPVDFGEESNDLIQMILNLQPSDTELSYMLCQLCFHHVAKKCPGEIQDVMEKFQETLSNHLHNYYINELDKPMYSKRVASMMKINNALEKQIYRDRVRADLMKVFDIFHVNYSPPGLIVQS